MNKLTEDELKSILDCIETVEEETGAEWDDKLKSKIKTILSICTCLERDIYVDIDDRDFYKCQICGLKVYLGNF